MKYNPDREDPSEGRVSSRILTYIENNNIKVPELIMDIGANNGKYFSNSLFFINKGWKAILIEPLHIQVLDLYKLYHDKLDKVQIWPFAVGDVDKDAVLYGHKNDGNGYKTANQGASLISMPHPVKWMVRCISGGTLSKMIDFDQVGILSIDAQGFDYRILKSIFEATTQRPPIIITEVWQADEAEKMKLLKDNNYIQRAKLGHNKWFELIKENES